MGAPRGWSPRQLIKCPFSRTINQVPFLQDFHWPQKTEGAEILRRALFWFLAGNVH